MSGEGYFNATVDIYIYTILEFLPMLNAFFHIFSFMHEMRSKIKSLRGSKRMYKKMLSTAHHCVSEFRRTEELNNPNFPLKKSVDLKLGCIAQYGIVLRR